MKEQLIKLKNNVKELADTTNRFVKRREIFNFEVKEALEEMEIEEFFTTDAKDSYARACTLYNIEGDLIQVVEELKQQYPKYGENRIKNLAKKQYLTTLETSSEEYINCIDRILELYFLYESYGFSKIRSLEEKKNEISSGMINSAKNSVEYVTNNSDIIWEETKGKASDVLTKTRRKIGKFLLDMDNK